MKEFFSNPIYRSSIPESQRKRNFKKVHFVTVKQDFTMESLLKTLKEQVTCSICLDTFTDPKTITCLHTFCCECLKKHALISQRNGTFRCPECQAEVYLPEANRFDKLLTSFHHNRLLSLLAVRQSSDGNETRCSICKIKSAEISYCFECTKFMCSDCVNAHQLFSHFTDGHKVMPVKQFQPEDYEALMKRQSFCSQRYHEREVLRYFCLKCKLCVCQICLTTDHKPHEGHDVELLDKVADVEKAKILERVDMLKGKTKIYREAIHNVAKTELELQTNAMDAKREVSHTVEQMIAEIRERELEIFTLLENTRVSRLEMINSAKTHFQSLLKQINQAVEFGENLLQRSSSSNIMQWKPKLEQCCHYLEDTPILEFPVSSFVKYFPNFEPEKLNVGFVATSEPIIEGMNQVFQAGVESELKVYPRIQDGVKSKLRVEVLVQPFDKVGSLKTYGEEDGSLQVKFTPKVPGTFNILVSINGKVLTTSSYTVQVQQRVIQVVRELELQGESLQAPTGIAVNSKGQIAVADKKKHCVLIIDEERNCVRKLGCHGSNAGQLNYPLGVTYLDDDNILVADQANHRIQQFNVQTGNSVKSFGKKGTGDGEFRNPFSVCVDHKGRVIVADYNNSRIQVLSQNGELLLKFGDRGPGRLSSPCSCIYQEDMFIVSEWGNHCLKVHNNSGTFLHKIGEQGELDDQLHRPWGLCVHKQGNHHNLLVCNARNGRVDQFTMESRFTGKTIDTLEYPVGITTTPDGLILVSDTDAKKIYVLK